MENSSNSKLWRNYIFAGVGLLVLFLIFRKWWTGNPQGAIRSVEEIQEQVQDSIRKQAIILRDLFVLDSAKQWFLIPTGQVDLEKEERVGFPAMSNESSPYPSGYTKKFPPSNNLLFYDGLSGTVHPLFKNRVSIDGYEFLEKSVGPSVLISFSDFDSNKDGFLGSSDLQKSAVWMPTWAELKILELPDKTILSTIRATKDFAVLQVGEDRDRDGVFEPALEPIVFYRLNFKCAEPACLEFRQVVPDAVLQDLQRVLDGF